MTDAPLPAPPVPQGTTRTAADPLGAAFADQHRRDERGWRIHLFLGCFWCFFASWPVSFMEIASAPLIVCFLIRLPWIWRALHLVFRNPVFVLAVAWGIWQGVTLIWSPDPAQGLDEWSSVRWFWCLFVLWPVLDGRRWLIGALAAGFLCGNASQLVQLAAPWVGIEHLPWERLPDRISGWWDPAVAGSLLMVPLGLHLPAAFLGRGWWRIAGTAGTAVTVTGILATGTRGAWVASAALLCLVVGIAAFSVRPRRRLVRPVAVAAGVLAIAIACAWVVFGPGIAARAKTGWRETVAALRERDYQTNTGARILMWHIGADAAIDRPIAGVGVGGFRSRMREATGDLESPPPLHDHAHNELVHTAATTGLIGVALIGAVLVLGLRGSVRGLKGGGGGPGSYDAGPACALAGLILVSAFDTIHVNTQTAAHLATILALCLWPRPERWRGGEAA